MQDLLLFFEGMPSYYKLIWIIACLSFIWALEGFFNPLFKLNYRKWKHAGVNFFFLFTTISINLIYGVATVGIFAWTQEHHFGLLYLVDLPLWTELLLSFLILDFTAQYLVHFLLHKVPWMWRLHLVHHSDTNVDATTGTRHHPLDYILRESFALVAITIAGAPVSFYIFYRLVTIFFAYWTHINMSLPTWFDKTVGLILITPNMHKFHHHHERPWTDSNFGNIFSIWDRIFGTFNFGDPKEVVYGLDVMDGSKDEDIMYQLKSPFDKSIMSDTDLVEEKVN